jgi:hypothetical protein
VKKIENEGHRLDAEVKQQVQRLARAAKRAMAGRNLLFAENDMLLKQNNLKTFRQSAKSNVLGNARVMSYQKPRTWTTRELWNTT